MLIEQVVIELQNLVRERLFESDRWFPGDAEAAGALQMRLAPLMLSEPVPGEECMTRYTVLGKRINAQLYTMGFLGLAEPWAVPEILQWNGLLAQKSMKRLMRRVWAGEDPEIVLRPFAQAAYLKYLKLLRRENGWWLQ
jgi:hypothetical protein